ncbi:DUF2812 domain-containing protein [Macrococcus brunensis]|uniref:DUF2812 domain-containing protein n=1 Tax=Macrococcus brunensis TaxID=198483 RepID=A0A4R6BFV7_9STAP|nr:DUF2812 domain-containing protein [Macrococcus brunensis]TDL98688.1 DUF2812 domain-containing protein [Macrococcus brunensis]
MTKVVRKWFLVHNYQKEEDWLNEMANAGHKLVKARLGKYIFEETDEHETIRMVYLGQERKKFIEFVKDMGIEHVATISNWGYFRKEDIPGEPPFEMFSDYESRVKHLNGVLNMLMIMTLLEIIIFIFNAIVGFNNGNTANIFVSITILILIILLSFATYKISLDIRKMKEISKIEQ